MVLFSGFASSAFGAPSTTIVISQIYGAGGNSGAVLNQDYVELFNLGSTPVSLNGWSLQYRSATGTSVVASTEVAPLPDVTIQPGHFFLVAASDATATGASFTSDFKTAPPLNLAGGAGQVILSNTTVAFPAGCNLTTGTVVDMVGYGTTTTGCSEGAHTTTTISATIAAVRTNPCVDTDNNANDFSTATVTTSLPRTSASPAVSCTTGPVSLSFTATATPSTVTIGSTTLLTARVTPATGGTNTVVTADLSGVGGSATQPLYDDGTHGDTTANDNVYNYDATIAGTATGTIPVKFTATDDQAHSATQTLNLDVSAPVAITPIHTIQAGAPASAYLGQNVTVSGIITAIKASGFFLQARDSDIDADPNTSEAIYVLSGPSSSIVVGNEVRVTGTVQLASTFSPAPDIVPGTQIGGSVTVAYISGSNPLPAPVVLTAADDNPAGDFFQFLKFQSMRISIPNFITTAPTGGTLVESTETVTSSGQFYGVVQGVARPFAEPGISVLEYQLPSGPTYCTTSITTNCVPRFDGNPENILVDSVALGGAPLDVTSNQTITNLLGIMDFNNYDSANSILRANLLLDKTNPGTLGAPMTYIPVPVAAANEFTIGTMNLERFYSDQPSGNGGVQLTTDAYQRRLAKASLLIRNVLRTPDILGIQEMGTLATLQDLATKISADATSNGQTDPHYSAYLEQGNDSTGINVGFLVNTNRVTVVDVTQFGKIDTYTNSTATQALLNDRPPLVLHAKVISAGNYPVTVITNHLKSLIGVDEVSNSGANVRLKRENQAEYLANLINGYVANGEHVVALGDMNAYPFSDGYVDTMGVLKGTPTPAAEVVVGPTGNYVAPSPALVDLESTIADPQARYDYTFNGNAQILDHIIVTPDLVGGTHLSYAHENGDFPLIQYNDATTPQSSSDHDGGVAYFSVSSSVPNSATLTPTSHDFGSVLSGTAGTPVPFTFTNTGTGELNSIVVTPSGDFSVSSTTCSATLAVSSTCTINVVFQPSTTGLRTGSLQVASNAITPTLTSALTGTGTTQTTLSPASATFPNTLVGSSSASQPFTLTNTSGTVLTIASGGITVGANYSQTNNCGTSLAIAATCTINVTFTPTAAGTLPGQLSVTTSAGGTPSTLTSTLSGTSNDLATLTPSTFTFASTGVGATSASQTFTITNTSGGILTFSPTSILATGDFSETNTCGTALGASGTCAIKVSFTPTALGTRTGTLSVTALSGPSSSIVLTSSLSGAGVPLVDFTLTASSSSGTVTPGGTATGTITLTSLNTYTGTVNLTCAGAPLNSTCTVTPPSVAITGPGTTSISVSLVTKAATTSKIAGVVSVNGPFGVMLLALSLAAGTFVMGRRKSALRGAGLLAVLLAVSIYAMGCANNSDDDNDSGGGSSGTSKGTYPLTITATDGTNTHSLVYTVTVQ